MWLKLSAILGLIAICSLGCALNINEEIEIQGYGEISAETNGDNSVYDKLVGYGDNQTYSRELTTYGYGQAKLTSNYVYRNSKRINDANASGTYRAGLRMPEGIYHSISIQSNNSIDSTSIISYENGGIESGKTYFDIEALQGNLSESVIDYSKRFPDFIASTGVKGNLTLFNELDESYRTSCAVEVLRQKMDDVKLQGIYPVKEIYPKYPQIIYMEGKEASGDVQASYYLRDASELINAARAGTDAIAKENYEKALMLAEKALEVDPENSDGWTIEGHALSGLNRIEDAEFAYDKAVKLNPDNTIAIFGKAETLFAMGRYRTSVEYYDRGLRLSPNENPDYWFNKADAHDKLNEPDDAILAIDKYISLVGDEQDAILFKAELLYDKGDYQGAIPLWEDYLPTEPRSNEFGSLYYYKGLTYKEAALIDSKNKEWTRAKDRLEKAKESFNKAKELDTALSEDADIEINLCNKYLKDIGASSSSANAGTVGSSPANV